MMGWHFVADDRKLGYGDGRIVKAGKTYKVSKARPLELCEYGLHASKRLIDALQYAPGSIICRVELVGEIEKGDDKSCAYERRVISMIDGTKILHEFACRSAEYALKFVKKTDPRSLAAIQAKRDWLAGKITDEDLAAARDAARYAARYAAWDAARDAAWAAAWDAARDAARYAAWAAAWDAAGRRDAARYALNKILTEMVKAEIRKGGAA